MLQCNWNHAERVNYWKTGQSDPDKWLDRAVKEIRGVGGTVQSRGYVSNEETGRGGFLLAFTIGPDRFALKWPVLESKTKDLRAARIQAATALFYEVKAACVKLKFMGPRAAFLSSLMLPNGRTAAEASDAALVAALPKMLTGTVQETP